ncbi:FtsX-like permease family protein [Marivirga sp. S37H4]|uniref:FtsX-like permease family protein n=1 Tax=Marivirga aurantiaca TaxID=2802615 RepID=A0A934X0Q7_9BACT|nr:FtsX-like permease family protein [Marivirga aurantiaca]MBK6266361.1 FtsX-like permease family protein [Marivirga aurantiaca]
MWKNYLKIAFRNLIKNKLYTGINLFGLSVGLGVSILILLFIQYENSFDQFHENEERIGRVLWVGEDEDGTLSQTASAPMAVPHALKENFEEVLGTTHFVDTENLTKIEGGETALLQSASIVGEDFLKIFSFPIIKGDPNPIAGKNTIAITASTATKYFGKEEAIGKILLIQLGPEYQPYKVRDILKDPPKKSSIQFEILMSEQNLSAFIEERQLENWEITYGESYVSMKEGYTLASLEEKVPSLIKSAIGQEDFEEEYYDLDFQPIESVHLNPEVTGGILETTDPQLLWILFSVSIMILLIACINFTTMAIGRSATRAKEVGVRKTMGAAYKQLFGQFMTESFIITILSTLLGVLLAQLLLPVFNSLFEKSLVIAFEPVQILIVCALMLLITFIAGAYPALFLSNLRPIQVLKGNLQMNFGKQNLRKGLVGLQFFISLFLIACTLIMYKQMQQINQYDLGFTKDNIIEVKIPPVPSENFITALENSFKKGERFKLAIKRRKEVENAGLAISTYGNNSWWNAGFADSDGNMFYYRLNFIDTHYAEVLGLQFEQGRNLSEKFPSDSSAFIINEAFVHASKMENPLQDQVGPAGKYNDHRIIGVVKDFHHASLYSKIEPVMMTMNPELALSGINSLNIPGSLGPTLLVKSSSDDFQTLISVLKEEWTQLYPSEPFEYSFFDESIQKQYQADERLGKLVGLSAIIAVIIAALGLFALASLSITGRMKEIGIRKVMGASAYNISLMFNKEFLKITLIGIILAMPFSYWLMNKWLEQFEIKSTPGAGIFIITVTIGVFFTIFIVSLQTVKASLMNPVKSLKEE